MKQKTWKWNEGHKPYGYKISFKTITFWLCKLEYNLEIK